MIADEFITIKNIMEISKLYKHSNYHNIFLKKFRSNYENYIAIRVLIDYCCELSKTNEYPKSTELDDLIRFTKKNDKAQSLKKYLTYLKGYDDKKGTNQASETYADHMYIYSMGVGELSLRMKTFLEKNKSFNMDNIEAIYTQKTNDDLEFYARTQQETFKIEKVYGKTPNCFKIKGVLFERLTLSELINIINYSNCIDKLTIDNIQVAYNFLR